MMNGDERCVTVFGLHRFGELGTVTAESAQDVKAGDLRRAIANSETYAIECGGEIEAIIGLKGGIISETTEMWAVFTQYAGLGTVRFLKRQMPRKLREFGALYMFTNPEIPKVEEFAKFMGFQAVGQLEPGYTIWRASSECRH